MTSHTRAWLARAPVFAGMVLVGLLAPTPVIAEPVVKAGTALVPYESPCGPDGVGVLSAKGRLRRVMLPGAGTGQASIAAGPSGFAAAWRTRDRRVVSASFDPKSGFGLPTVHGPLLKGSFGPQVVVTQAGDRAVLWEDDQGIRLQRVGADGRPQAALLVRRHKPKGQEEEGTLFPSLIASGREGNLWIAWYDPRFEPRNVLTGRRVSGESMGPEIELFRPPDQQFVNHSGFAGLAPDGQGGIYALIAYDDDTSDEMDPSAAGPATQTLLAVGVDREDQLRQRQAARLTGGYLEGSLAAVSGHAYIAYHAYSGRRRGVYARRLGVGADLSIPRRLRRESKHLERDHFVVASAIRPGTVDLFLLLGTPFRGEERLYLQRAPGRRRAGRIRLIADAGRDKEGAGRAFTQQSFALDRRGRAFITWARGSDYDPDAAFTRVIRGSRRTPVRTLWRCRGG